MRKLVLIDSNALVHRAFHALPPLTSPSGQMTNAVYGFASVLVKMINDLKPDLMVATFDMAAPTFRHTEYAEYKAHRQKAPQELYDQIPLVKELLAGFGVPIYELSGFEADDVIGTIATRMEQEPDVQTIIVTGDMDTLQLVRGTKTVVFTLRKGMTDTVTYDEDGVRARLGVGPEHVIDLKGLKGDPSDNIPGVPGIGDKTAAALVTAFGTVEQVIEAAQQDNPQKPLTPKLTETLRTHAEEALFSKRLATITTDAPVAFDLASADWKRHADIAVLEAFCNRMGFASLIRRVRDAASPQESLLVPTQTIAPTQASLPSVTLDEVPSQAVIALALNEEGMATLSLDGTTARLLGTLTAEDLQSLASRSKTLFLYDAKQYWHRLQMPEHVAVPPQIVDVTINAWILDPEGRSFEHERIVMTYAPTHIGSPSACGLWHAGTAIMRIREEQHMTHLYTDIDHPLISVLYDMERRGIQVNPGHLAELSKQGLLDIAQLETDIYGMAGKEFNINSPAQVGEVLFTTLGLKGHVRKTSGGALSTAASELEKLRDEHPIVERILEYRELAKLMSTYIEPFPALIGPDGRIHTTYHQVGTATGRLSSSDPNLQNIPTRTALGQQFRGAFVAQPGFTLLSLDYSQLELRIVAHAAQDSTMMEAFAQGQDIHTRTASEVFGIAPDQVTKDMRRQAKALNFGIIYGMGVLGFARSAGVDRAQAKAFMQSYFERFSGVAQFMEHQKQESARTGATQNLLGRKRPLPHIKGSMPQLVAQAERIAINHPVQSTGADIMKKAMIAIDTHLADNNLSHQVRLLLQVHDELVFEVQTALMPSIVAPLVDLMEHTHTLSVPLIADAKQGTSWASMAPLIR